MRSKFQVPALKARGTHAASLTYLALPSARKTSFWAGNNLISKPRHPTAEGNANLGLPKREYTSLCESAVHLPRLTCTKRPIHTHPCLSSVCASSCPDR